MKHHAGRWPLHLATWSCLAAASIGPGATSGCGGRPTIDPSRVELSSDPDTHTELARMRLVWESGDEAERRALESDLLGYTKRFSKDPTARVTAVMAAVLLVERGELEGAKRLVALAPIWPAGPTRDMAAVVRGAIDRRRGQAQAALDQLEPLFLRVIDGPTRTLLNEELLRAAVDAGRFEPALTYLRAWLDEAPKSRRRAVTEAAGQLLGRFPPAPMLAALAAERRAERGDAGLSELLAERIADVVLSRDDAALARELLEVAGELLGERTDAVAKVAARGASVKIDRDTVGLLLPRRSEHLARRGVDVVSGMSFALGIPAGRARVLTRDDGGSLEGVIDAVTLLQAEGAALVVAGYERDEADLVTKHAERTGAVVLLLTAPSKPPRADGTVFVLGVDPRAVRARLIEALAARNRAPVAMVADERTGASVPDSAELVAVQPCGSALDFLDQSRARGVLVDGDDRCATDLRERGPGARLLAFGLDARDAGSGLHASAGWVGAPGDRGASPLDAWRASGRREAGWWTGLGHDAGALARIAVESIPEEVSAETPGATSKRGIALSRVLAKAGAPLWTTEARGFEGARVMPRAIEVVERR